MVYILHDTSDHGEGKRWYCEEEGGGGGGGEGGNMDYCLSKNRLDCKKKIDWISYYLGLSLYHYFYLQTTSFRNYENRMPFNNF